MRVADHADVLARSAELHRHHRFGDQLASERPDDVHAEDLVGACVGDELDQPARIAERPRARIGGEREAAGAVVGAARLQLLLGLADPGDLRGGVDHPGDGIEVDMRLLAGDALGDRHPLLLGLVREHRPAHHVADRPDIGQVAPAVAVDGYEAALIQLEAHGGRVQAFGIGQPADGNDQAVTIQCFR